MKCKNCLSAKVIKKHSKVNDFYFKTPGSWDFHKCIQCNHLFISPTPSDTELKNAYNNYYTRKSEFACKNYPSKRLADFFDPFLCNFLKIELSCESKKSKKILDYGCGSGVILSLLRNRNLKKFGYDVDRHALRVAHVQNPRARFFTTVRTMQKKNIKFDVIIMRHVIEHVKSPSYTLKSLLCLMKKNSKLVILTPNCLSVGSALFRKYWRGLEAPRHLNIYSKNSLSYLIEKNNLTRFRLFSSSKLAQPMSFVSIYLMLNKIFHFSRSDTLRKLAAYGLSRIVSFFSLILVKISPYSGEELIAIYEKK